MTPHQLQAELSTHPLTPHITRMVGDEKHLASAYGTIHVIWALYDRVLRIDPQRPQWPDRDRFLVSKGHGPMAYFAALADKGFFDTRWLDRFMKFDGRLGAHPDRLLVPGVEVSSGSLGHGLPMAVGIALALSARQNRTSRVFCLLGDGELDEGSNHEAIAFAGRRNLGALTAIVVDNSSASMGWPGGIEARFVVEGWRAHVVDGQDEDALAAVLDDKVGDAPRVVIARVQGKGS